MFVFIEVHNNLRTFVRNIETLLVCMLRILCLIIHENELNAVLVHNQPLEVIIVPLDSGKLDNMVFGIFFKLFLCLFKFFRVALSDLCKLGIALVTHLAYVSVAFELPTEIVSFLNLYIVGTIVTVDHGAIIDRNLPETHSLAVNWLTDQLHLMVVWTHQNICIFLNNFISCFCFNESFFNFWRHHNAFLLLN